LIALAQQDWSNPTLVLVGLTAQHMLLPQELLTLFHALLELTQAISIFPLPLNARLAPQEGTA